MLQVECTALYYINTVHLVLIINPTLGQNTMMIFFIKAVNLKCNVNAALLLFYWYKMVIITRNVFCQTNAWDQKRQWTAELVLLPHTYSYKLPAYLQEHPQLNSLIPLPLLRLLCLLEHVWHSRCRIRLFHLWFTVRIKTLVQQRQGSLLGITLDKRDLHSTMKINNMPSWK